MTIMNAEAIGKDSSPELKTGVLQQQDVSRIRVAEWNQIRDKIKAFYSICHEQENYPDPYHDPDQTAIFFHEG
jgi:hypothetical protein